MHHSSRRFEPSIDKDRSKNRFECVGKKSAFLATAAELFTATEEEACAEIDGSSYLDQMSCADDAGFMNTELTLGEFGMGAKEEFADEEAENGIPQEFELFVVLGHFLTALTPFAIETAVRKGTKSQTLIGKLVTDAGFEQNYLGEYLAG